MRRHRQGVPCLPRIFDGRGVGFGAVVELVAVDVARRDDDEPRGVRGGRGEEAQLDPFTDDVAARGESIDGRGPERGLARPVRGCADRHAEYPRPGDSDLRERDGVRSERSEVERVSGRLICGRRDAHRLETVLELDLPRRHQERVEVPVQGEPGHRRAVAADVVAGDTDDGVHVSGRQRVSEEDVPAKHAGVEMGHDGCPLVGGHDPVGEILHVFVLLVQRKVVHRVDELGLADFRERDVRERQALQLIPRRLDPHNDAIAESDRARHGAQTERGGVRVQSLDARLRGVQPQLPTSAGPARAVRPLTSRDRGGPLDGCVRCSR